MLKTDVACPTGALSTRRILWTWSQNLFGALMVGAFGASLWLLDFSPVPGDRSDAMAQSSVYAGFVAGFMLDICEAGSSASSLSGNT